MALVAMVMLVLCTCEAASARLMLPSARHAHRGLRRELLASRSSADCPKNNGTLTPLVQDQIAKLSSASMRQGGKQMEQDTVLPDGQQVHVQAKSQQSGSSRSWAWSWSSHSSWSSSSSSKSSNAWGARDSSADDKAHPSLKLEREISSVSSPTSSPKEQDRRPKENPVYAVVRSSRSQHHSDTKAQESFTAKNKDGKVTRSFRSSESSSSSSTLSSSTFSTVNNYVISGNAEKSGNAAPFTDPQVQWTRTPPLFSAAFSVNTAIGHHITRPARADVCNRRFPFSNQQHGRDHEDPRFSQPFAEEGLDPVSRLALDLHNAERARYHLPPLQWNAELANMASCWADLKAYGHSEEHFVASGENIARGIGDPCYSSPMEGMKNGVYSFLDEDRNWAQNPHLSEADGHWTQIVWKDTRFVGCAVSQRKHFTPESVQEEKASMYIVCEYYPAGNVEGLFDAQVPAKVQPTPRLRSSCSANERHGS